MEAEEIKELISQSSKGIEFLIQNGKITEALLLGKQANLVDPENREIRLGLAAAESYNGNLKEAENILLKLIEEDATDFRAYNNLGITYSMSKKNDQAIDLFIKCYKLGGSPAALSNAALEMAKIGQDPEQLFQEAISKDEKLRFNLAGYYHSIHKWNEAELEYRKIIKYDPLNANAKFNLGCLLASGGNYSEGFQLMEARWQAFPHLLNARAKLKYPDWDGAENKTLLFFCEQGLGDYIQFLRYIPHIKAKKIYVCGEDISKLFKLNNWQGEEVDYCLSVMSLPRFFNYIPKPIELENKAGNGTGLAWCGSPKHKDDNSRSIHLNRFGNGWKLLGRNYGPRKINSGIINWESQTDIDYQFDGNLFDLVNSINDCKKIVTVDTAVVHLAGSLNKETLLLLPYNAEWRWGRSGNTTEWYPSVKITRQIKSGDWSEPLKDALLFKE